MTEGNESQSEMPKAFDPQAVEAGWYARWEADALFVADPNSDKPKFTMCFPPPNITGELHMGHALQTEIYDLIARFRRMNGQEVLFLPGYDQRGAGPRALCGPRRGLVRAGGRHDHQPASPARSVDGLEPAAVHDGLEIRPL